MDWISKTIGRYLSLGILFLQSAEKYDAGKYFLVILVLGIFHN